MVYCANCGAEVWKDHYSVAHSKTGRFYCSRECRYEYQRRKTIEVECSNCGKKYFTNAFGSLNEFQFCSDQCRDHYHQDHPTDGQVELVCEHCGKHFIRPKAEAIRTEHHYCDKKCAGAAKRRRVTNTCQYCGREYEHIQALDGVSKFCSRECADAFCRENVKRGKDSPFYNRVVTSCQWCGKELEVPPYRLKHRVFCNTACRQQWFKNVYLASPDARELLRIAGAKGCQAQEDKMLTQPQLVVNEMLDALGIEYRLQYPVDFYTLDVYLSDRNLGIEVQGDYWHMNPTIFSEIKYDERLRGILKEQSRHAFIVERRGIPILYLWENDLNNRRDVCEALLKTYIANFGMLDDYHSFNYSYHDAKLLLNTSRIRPYIEYGFDELPLSKELRTHYFNIA